MLNLVRRTVLRITLTRASVAAGRRLPNLLFAGPQAAGRVAELARRRGVVIVQAGVIHRHYYYSEPGNPLVRRAHDSVADFLLSLLGADLNAASRLYGMAIAYQPDKAPSNEIKGYVERQLAAGRKLSNLAAIELALKLTGPLSTAAHARLDRFLAGPWVWLAESIIFGGDRLSRTERLECWQGPWTGRSQFRRFTEASSEVRTSTGGLRSNSKYEILGTANRVCLIRVQPSDDSLAYIERLIPSQDRQSLVIHSHEDAESFLRPSTP